MKAHFVLAVAAIALVGCSPRPTAPPPSSPKPPVAEAPRVDRDFIASYEQELLVDPYFEAQPFFAVRFDGPPNCQVAWQRDLDANAALVSQGQKGIRLQLGGGAGDRIGSVRLHDGPDLGKIDLTFARKGFGEFEKRLAVS